MPTLHVSLQILSSAGSVGTLGAPELVSFSVLLLAMPLEALPELESHLAGDAVVSLTCLEVDVPGMEKYIEFLFSCNLKWITSYHLALRPISGNMTKI